ncbi:MAG: phage integrase SAM-like domain-containing protein [Pseudomonadota bacterium]
MTKRKSFFKTDLSIPKVTHSVGKLGEIRIASNKIPPTLTVISFPKYETTNRNFDFAKWYGRGIDQITYACQTQIERFLAKQDSNVSTTTVSGFCSTGLNNFLNYSVLQSRAARMPLMLEAIDREFIDGFRDFLRQKGITTVSQKAIYKNVKAVLMAVARRGLIKVVSEGEESTFPRNPYSGASQQSKGQKPLPSSQRKDFTAAVKTAVMPIFLSDEEPSGDLLAYALLVVALHTGRNTTPLIEMPLDCLRSHPKNDTAFLVLYKRRGHSISKVPLRLAAHTTSVVESTPTVRPTIVRLIQRVIDLTEPMRRDAPEILKDRVWIYRSRSSGHQDLGQITALTPGRLNLTVSQE